MLDIRKMIGLLAQSVGACSLCKKKDTCTIREFSQGDKVRISLPDLNAEGVVTNNSHNIISIMPVSGHGWSIDIDKENIQKVGHHTFEECKHSYKIYSARSICRMK